MSVRYFEIWWNMRLKMQEKSEGYVQKSGANVFCSGAACHAAGL